MTTTGTARVDSAEWTVWTTTARVVVRDPGRLAAARAVVERVIADVDAAASRFRPDSELSRLTGRTTVSPLFAAMVRAATGAAADTGGAVDPTLGSALRALADPAAPPVTGFGRWRELRLDGDVLTVPPGVTLDLGATGKAFAADQAARWAAARTGTGVLVSLGGDIATAGPAPDGWTVLVGDGPDQPECVIRLAGGGALATSSTLHRAWRRGDARLHHILDPRDCRPAAPVWRTATVAADSCVAANTASTAAVVLGERAPEWLSARGRAARLVAADGTVHRTGSWPGAA